jgi:hypothetical protein
MNGVQSHQSHEAPRLTARAAATIIVCAFGAHWILGILVTGVGLRLDLRKTSAMHRKILIADVGPR